jgi:leader peptidase (prepilin peptidase)/N-methyltransferase
MEWFILFILGLAVGSFLNVVAMRYDGGETAPLFSPHAIGGRSHCPHCRTTLRWFELIPLVTWVLQRGHCRTCHARIGWRYPLTELISGFIVMLVPFRVISAAAIGAGAPGMGALLWLSFFWVVIFEALFLMALVDIRLGIIPDGLNLSLFLIGLFFVIYLGGTLGLQNASLLGPYAGIFGLQGNLWLNRVAGALFAGGLFGLLIAGTRGKGMGFGDLKLVIPLGFILGWPDILFALASAFVIGAAAGVTAIAMKKRTMKGALPFGPFLALGAAAVFFFGYQFVRWYFRV